MVYFKTTGFDIKTSANASVRITSEHATLAWYLPIWNSRSFRLQQTNQNCDKSVKAKQQLIVYFSRTPAMQKIKPSASEKSTRQAVPNRKL